MPGRGIDKLRKPPKSFRVQGRTNFETRERAGHEDRTRARLLRRQAVEDPVNAERLLDLAARLNPKNPGFPKTVASSRYMRRHRIRMVGWLWWLYQSIYYGYSQAVTLLPSGVTLSVEELHHISPARFKRALLADLLRTALVGKDGFLFAALHGEFDPGTGMFRPHWHIMASGSYLRAVEALRKQRKYLPRDRSPFADAACVPIQIKRQPLTDLPAPLTYIVQSWWPAKSRMAIGETGDRSCPRRRRIPEPAHSAYLLWLDQQRLQDLVLMVRLRVINGRVQPR